MTNNKQQTAVEWFANESWQLKVQLENEEISVDEYAVSYVRLLYKAKAMHKQEIINFGCLLTQAPQHIIEEAYNETYGGGEK
jgi:glycerol dehydrogenase-like iron-containing ADH family enzyme